MLKNISIVLYTEYAVFKICTLHLFCYFDFNNVLINAEVNMN